MVTDEAFWLRLSGGLLGGGGGDGGLWRWWVVIFWCRSFRVLHSLLLAMECSTGYKFTANNTQRFKEIKMINEEVGLISV